MYLNTFIFTRCYINKADMLLKIPVPVSGLISFQRLGNCGEVRKCNIIIYIPPNNHTTMRRYLSNDSLLIINYWLVGDHLLSRIFWALWDIYGVCVLL